MAAAPRHACLEIPPLSLAAPRSAVLGLLTASYLLGELGHFLLGATSRAMAQELEFGEEGCLCGDQLEEEECQAAGCLPWAPVLLCWALEVLPPG